MVKTPTKARRITTTEATLKTATVEIKTLTLSGKQMTLAVFRQLIEDRVIDTDTGKLRGDLWGVVNYHSGVDCDDISNDDHFHVVWQMGNELRRSCALKWGLSKYDGRVGARVWNDSVRCKKADTLSDMYASYYAALSLFSEARGQEISWPEHIVAKMKSDVRSRSYDDYRRNNNGVRLMGELDIRFYLPVGVVWLGGYEDGRDKDAALQELRKDLGDEWEVSPEEWKKRLEAAIEDLRNYTANYQTSYAKIEALDQLFIAV